MENLNNTQRATDFLFRKFPEAKKIADNKAKFKRIRLPGDEEDTYLWAVKTGESTYGGVTIYEDVYQFTRKEFIEWYPYHGQILSSKIRIYFYLQENLLNILWNDTEEKAREAILREADFKTARGPMHFIESYENLDGSRTQKLLQGFWALRMNMNGFAAISPFSREPIHIPNINVQHLHDGDIVRWPNASREERHLVLSRDKAGKLILK